VSGREIYAGNTLERDLALEGDVVIIGSGAGGAISAEILSRAGLRVLIVEEGAYRTPQDFVPREVPAFSQLYFEGGVRQTRDGGIGVVQGRTVGGSTTVNWTSSFRTPEPTLRYWRDVLGVEGLGTADLDPWFTRIEQRLHIAPWEAPNLNNQLLARGAAKLGWQFGTIHRNVHNCANLGFCGLGCPIGAKQSMDVTAIPDALDHGAVLVTRVRAERLVLAADRVASVECLALDDRGTSPSGVRATLRAPWVILAAAAINTPALLMASQVPDPHRRVGKRTFLQTHNYSLAFMPEPVYPFYGAQQSVYTDQFTWRDGVTGRAGFNMEVAGAQPVVSMNGWRGIGGEMADFARRLPHLHTLVSQIRDGFHPDSPGGEVHLGDNGRAVLDYPLNDFFWDGVRSSYLAMAECQFAAGAESVHPASSDATAYRTWEQARREIAALPLRSPNVYLNSTHPLGGCPMGPDPRDSVVDPFGRHHHITNLAIIDGSILPTSLGVNPSLTIYALAARNASALVQHIRP